MTRRRDSRTPDSGGGSGDVLNQHKNTCLFPGRQFTVPEIPSEPVSGVQEGARGCSLGETSLPTLEVTDSLLITDTNCNEEIDTWTLIKSTPCSCNRAAAQLQISTHQHSWAPDPSHTSYIFYLIDSMTHWLVLENRTHGRSSPLRCVETAHSPEGMEEA